MGLHYINSTGVATGAFSATCAVYAQERIGRPSGRPAAIGSMLRALVAQARDSGFDSWVTPGFSLPLFIPQKL